MDFVAGAGSTALAAADTFEDFLYRAAAAQANGFVSVNAMVLRGCAWSLGIGGVFAALGGLEALVFDDEDEKKEREQQNSSWWRQAVAAGLMGMFITGFVQAARYRERMYLALTGTGTLEYKMKWVVGCVGIPAVVGFASAALSKKNKKAGVLIGAVLGTVLYVFIGCLPVIIREEQQQGEALMKMRDAFRDCYPLIEGGGAVPPCTETGRDIVRIWGNSIPAFVKKTLRIDKKDNLLKVLDVLVQKQKLDMGMALHKTPIGQLIARKFGLTTADAQKAAALTAIANGP